MKACRDLQVAVTVSLANLAAIRLSQLRDDRSLIPRVAQTVNLPLMFDVAQSACSPPGVMRYVSSTFVTGRLKFSAS